MKCYYEVLNVPKDVDDTTLKSAYKKLALKWHPDKNLDNPDLAKEQFQLIQQAYEVLSDRQERAWYDNHRDQILKGSSSNYEDHCLDVFQYFTTTCFNGYSDDETGFYAVYRKVFEQIANEDKEFMERDEIITIPGFGWANSDYDKVVKVFYNYWICYSTKKNYVWLDQYDIREGKGNRQLLKAMEKENKKIRNQARKERNEEVRNLVSFVRKRDRRVQAYSILQNERIMENRKKQEIISEQKRLERQQLYRDQKEAEWLKFDNVESELQEIEKNLSREFEALSADDNDNDDDDDKERNEELYCVACTKLFKNIKSFKNHEASRKHRENVEMLNMKEFNDEDEMDRNEFDDDDDDDGNGLEEDELDDVDNTLNKDSTSKKKKKKKKNKNVAVLRHDSDNEYHVDIKEPIEDEDLHFNNTKKKKNSKKTKSKTNNSGKQKPKTKVDEITVDNPIPINETQNTNNKSNDPVDVDTQQCCAVCHATFPSKNKLFSHLEKTGHSIYLPSNSKMKEKNMKKTTKNKH